MWLYRMVKSKVFKNLFTLSNCMIHGGDILVSIIQYQFGKILQLVLYVLVRSEPVQLIVQFQSCIPVPFQQDVLQSLGHKEQIVSEFITCG